MDALDVVQAGLVLNSQAPATANTTSATVPVNNGAAGNSTVSTTSTSSATASTSASQSSDTAASSQKSGGSTIDARFTAVSLVVGFALYRALVAS